MLNLERNMNRRLSSISRSGVHDGSADTAFQHAYKVFRSVVWNTIPLGELVVDSVEFAENAEPANNLNDTYRDMYDVVWREIHKQSPNVNENQLDVKLHLVVQNMMQIYRDQSIKQLNEAVHALVENLCEHLYSATNEIAGQCELIAQNSKTGDAFQYIQTKCFKYASGRNRLSADLRKLIAWQGMSDRFSVNVFYYHQLRITTYLALIDKFAPENKAHLLQYFLDQKTSYLDNINGVLDEGTWNYLQGDTEQGLRRFSIPEPDELQHLGGQDVTYVELHAAKGYLEKQEFCRKYKTFKTDEERLQKGVKKRHFFGGLLFGDHVLDKYLTSVIAKECVAIENDAKKKADATPVDKFLPRIFLIMAETIAMFTISTHSFVDNVWGSIFTQLYLPYPKDLYKCIDRDMSTNNIPRNTLVVREDQKRVLKMYHTSKFHLEGLRKLSKLIEEKIDQ